MIPYLLKRALKGSKFVRRSPDLFLNCSKPGFIPPFLIFKLRGKTKREIIEALRKRRVSTVETELTKGESTEGLVSGSNSEDVRPLEECLETFWDLSGDLLAVAPSPAPPKVSNAVLKSLGDAPYSIGKNNLAVLLSQAYEVAGRAALEKATRNGNGDTDADPRYELIR